MADHDVPAGQSGGTFTLAPGVQDTVRWTSATPMAVKLSATVAAVRYGFRGTAATGAAGVTTLPSGQSVTVGTQNESTPLVLYLASAGAAVVEVVGYRAQDEPIGDPPAPSGVRSAITIPSSTSVTAGTNYAVRVVTTNPRAYTLVPAAAGGTNLDAIPSLSTTFENGLT